MGLSQTRPIPRSPDGGNNKTIQVSAWTDWIKQKLKLSDSKEGEDPKVAFAADEEKIGTDEEEIGAGEEKIAADEEEIGADEGEFAKFFNSYK